MPDAKRSSTTWGGAVAAMAVTDAVQEMIRMVLMTKRLKILNANLLNQMQIKKPGPETAPPVRGISLNQIVCPLSFFNGGY